MQPPLYHWHSGRRIVINREKYLRLEGYETAFLSNLPDFNIDAGGRSKHPSFTPASEDASSDPTSPRAQSG
jgi:hypothetical protein